MPKLWSETISRHRQEVRDAIVRATVGLVGEHGLSAVSMSQIAAAVGIGRATLYKYFPDVGSVLRAWHEKNVNQHLQHLEHVRAAAGGDAGKQLEAVLHAYAVMVYERPSGTDLAAAIHQERSVTDATRRLRGFLSGLIEAARVSAPPKNAATTSELANYCVHALAAASEAPSPDAAHRLARITVTAVLSS